MIQTGTILKVSDNSGALTVKCLKILKGKYNVGIIGSLAIVSIKTLKTYKKLKKKEIKKAVVVLTTQYFNRINGFKLRFDINSVILINSAGLPLSTRIFGPVPYELRKKKYFKIILLASKVI